MTRLCSIRKPQEGDIPQIPPLCEAAFGAAEKGSELFQSGHLHIKKKTAVSAGVKRH